MLLAPQGRPSGVFSPEQPVGFRSAEGAQECCTGLFWGALCSVPPAVSVSTVSTLLRGTSSAPSQALSDGCRGVESRASWCRICPVTPTSGCASVGSYRRASPGSTHPRPFQDRAIRTAGTPWPASRCRTPVPRSTGAIGSASGCPPVPSSCPSPGASWPKRRGRRVRTLRRTALMLWPTEANSRSRSSKLAKPRA